VQGLRSAAQNENSDTAGTPDCERSSPATAISGHQTQKHSVTSSDEASLAPPSLPLGQQSLIAAPSTTLRPVAVTVADSSETSAPEFGRDDVFRKFSGWNGHFKVDNDGRISYYGATSDNHTSYESETSPASVEVESSSCSSSVLSGYSSFQQHLIELFFDHPHPFLRIPDREAFMDGLRRGRKTQYFSPFLLNCILLRSLHLSHNPLAKRLEEGLFERVREHMFNELEHPDHNTVLGLLFLSTYISGQLKHGLGWICVGK
jgi:hypothetical protein